MNRSWIFPLVLLASLVGCDDEDEMDTADTAAESETAGDTDDSNGEPTVDAQAVADQALMYETYTKVNADPLESVHGLADTMNVWVSPDAVATYESIAEGTVFAEGTMLVKEQLDADGSLNSLTVMFKGPAGYAPDAGDWWFGLVNPDGSLGPNGQPDACIGCHTTVSGQDWAYGLEGG